jgi:hypothetical protein
MVEWGTQSLGWIHAVQDKHWPTPHGGGEAGTVLLCLGIGKNQVDKIAIMMDLAPLSANQDI